MTAANVKGWTPGPWRADHDAELCRVSISCHRRIGKIDVAEIETGFIEPMESEQLANAALIAAAPDLYEALEELLRVDDEWHGAVNSEMAKARAKARAALSRATGAATKGDSHE